MPSLKKKQDSKVCALIRIDYLFIMNIISLKNSDNVLRLLGFTLKFIEAVKSPYASRVLVSTIKTLHNNKVTSQPSISLPFSSQLCRIFEEQFISDIALFEEIITALALKCPIGILNNNTPELSDKVRSPRFYSAEFKPEIDEIYKDFLKKAKEAHPERRINIDIEISRKKSSKRNLAISERKMIRKAIVEGKVKGLGGLQLLIFIAQESQVEINQILHIIPSVSE